MADAWDEEEPKVTKKAAEAPKADVLADVNPAGAGTPAGIPLPDPETVSPGAGDITLSAPAGSGLELPAYGLAVSDQPAAFAPEDAALLQDAAASQGIDLIEGGGS